MRFLPIINTNLAVFEVFEVYYPVLVFEVASKTSKTSAGPPTHQDSGLRSNGQSSCRGNELFAARVGRFKVHYWTWSHQHYQFCPGQLVNNLTTPNQVSLTVLFDITGAPGVPDFIMTIIGIERAFNAIFIVTAVTYHLEISRSTGRITR